MMSPAQKVSSAYPETETEGMLGNANAYRYIHINNNVVRVLFSQIQ